MKFKKIICTILLQFMLVLIFSNCTNANITAYAKTKKATTICIDNVNSKVCEKIHKNLSKGNPIVLKVKGKYCYYTVSADNAKAYKYGVKFIEELYKMPMTKIMASTCFGELSKANQVYFIEQSGYFATRDDMFKTKPKYTIRYSYDYLFDKKIKARTDFKTPGQGMEKMYKHNIIIGVCSVYADYEELLFSQLGIAVWNCSDDNIGHAWTVLKVKNTAGKTLWIPFDYSIGPAERLIIDEKIIKKYLRTEKMRYQLYLSKVKGAPKKKNFKLSDFV